MHLRLGYSTHQLTKVFCCLLPPSPLPSQSHTLPLTHHMHGPIPRKVVGPRARKQQVVLVLSRRGVADWRDPAKGRPHPAPNTSGYTVSAVQDQGQYDAGGASHACRQQRTHVTGRVGPAIPSCSQAEKLPAQSAWHMKLSSRKAAQEGGPPQPQPTPSRSHSILALAGSPVCHHRVDEADNHDLIHHVRLHQGGWSNQQCLRSLTL